MYVKLKALTLASKSCSLYMYSISSIKMLEEMF